MNDETALFTKACDALAKARCLELTYGGHDRVVEVHIAGYSDKGDALMRVWQVRGGSSSGEPTGWKMFRLRQATDMRLSREPSRAPRNTYRRDDPSIHRVVCQI